MTGPGTLLNSRWRLERLLGRGAMGVVYRAHDEVLQRPVAVKLLSPPLANDPMMLSRFQREAMASARLAHPNVVTTLDFRVDAGQPYMLMELALGRPLDTILDEHGPLHPSRAAQLARGVALGLAAAHEHGIVHRDIKPGNIMVDDVGGVSVARIMDFGVAQRSAAGPRLTMAGGAVGTPGYLAPERLGGQTVGPAADIFSLGITLYEMLAGRLPWITEEPLDLLAASLRDRPTPLSTAGRGVPGVLSRLVMAMIEQDPKQRPASATEVAAALGAYLADAPAQAGADASRSLDVSVLVVASVSPEPQRAAEQIGWFQGAVKAEGGAVAQFVRRELVSSLPTAEAAMRLTRTSPSPPTPRPALALHTGLAALDGTGVMLGAGVRAALRLARLASHGEVLLTTALHDDVGLGWRARVEPRGDFVLDTDTTFGVYALRGGPNESHVAARVEMHGDGPHWRCPCSAHGPVPADTDCPMRVRCSRCSRLLQLDPGVGPDPAPPADASDHPLSSIVLTSPRTHRTPTEQADDDLIAALTDPHE